MKVVGLLSVCILLAFCILVIPVAAYSSDYVVEPGYGSIGMPAPDLNPVSFWNLSPREMAVVGALVLFPAFTVPVELFFALKIFFALGFRRIARKNILDSVSRHAVYDCIHADPGIRITELVRNTGLSRGSVNYHLALLAITGKITTLRTHGDISYFENSGKYSPAEQKVLKYLRGETERRILSTLLAAPRATRSDLEEILSLSGPTVTWHMKRLSDDGMVTIAKDGRFSFYALSGTTRDYVGKHLGSLPSGSSYQEGYTPGSVMPAVKA